MKKTKNELKGNLTVEQLKAMKKEIAEALSRDRHKLLCEQPFVGNIAMRFDLIPVRDKRCRTACTDGNVIYFDCDFYSKLTPEERVFVMAHEIWHLVNLTFARRQTRDPELWNIAADMEINNILSDNSSSRSFIPPKNLMFPPQKMRGQSAETLYDWLLKQAEKNNLNNALSSMGDPRSSDNEDSDSNSSGGNKKNKQQKNNNGQREQRDESKDGKNTGRLEGQFDKHCYEGDSGDDEDENGNTQVGQQDDKSKNKKNGKGGSGCEDQWGEVGYDEDFKPHVSQDTAERMREAAISAAQAYQREHGSLPAGVEGLLDKLTKPEINWKEYLSQFVSQCYGGKRQWLPPSRRRLYDDLYFQSRRNERIKGVVAIDTSGSCIGDLPKFFGELKGLIESFGSYELTVIQADAAVDKVDVYDDGDNPLEFDGEIAVSGGGGTDYGPVFKYVEENGLAPDFLVYIGDGFANFSYDKVPLYPVMWLITKDGTFDFCDWGLKVKFKETSWN